MCSIRKRKMLFFFHQNILSCLQTMVYPRICKCFYVRHQKIDYITSAHLLFQYPFLEKAKLQLIKLQLIVPSLSGSFADQTEMTNPSITVFSYVLHCLSRQNATEMQTKISQESKQYYMIHTFNLAQQTKQWQQKFWISSISKTVPCSYCTILI